MGPQNNCTSAILPYHFLKLENKVEQSKVPDHQSSVTCPRFLESHKVNYILRNHFNTPVIKIEGAEGQAQKNELIFWKLQAINLKGKKNNITSNILFYMTVAGHLQRQHSEISECEKCTVAFTSGETLSHIIMKDIGLSTRSYVVMDNTNKPLFQVNREHILGQNELQIKLVFKEDVIARMHVDDNKINLSMAPELESTAKMRLICLMIFMEIVENRNTDKVAVFL